MALTTGPNIGLLDNGSPGEPHYAELMRQWRWLDFLLQAVVKSRVAAVPGSGMVDGDTYLITGATNQHKIARWTTRLGTAAWEYLTPKTGWRVRVADTLSGTQLVTYEFNGATWVDVTTGQATALNDLELKQWMGL